MAINRDDFMDYKQLVIFFATAIFLSFASKSQAQNIPPGAEPVAKLTQIKIASKSNCLNNFPKKFRPKFLQE